MLLERYNYSETETEGYLWIGEKKLYTLERPWIDESNEGIVFPGGMPFESCIPDGTYELIPHTRPNGDRVYALRNPKNHVYYTKDEKGDRSGRFLVLIHSGNYVDHVVGCVAPGLVRTIYNNRRMVGSSRLAMKEVMRGKHKQIEIRSRCGTLD